MTPPAPITYPPRTTPAEPTAPARAMHGMPALRDVPTRTLRSALAMPSVRTLRGMAARQSVRVLLRMPMRGVRALRGVPAGCMGRIEQRMRKGGTVRAVRTEHAGEAVLALWAAMLGLAVNLSLGFPADLFPVEARP
jgi:hypothetical protein